MLRADNFFLKLLLTQILCWILRDNTKEGGEASSGRPEGIKGLGVIASCLADREEKRTWALK